MYIQMCVCVCVCAHTGGERNRQNNVSREECSYLNMITMYKTVDLSIGDMFADTFVFHPIQGVRPGKE